MNILKKVILKYINDKDIGYSILSALCRLQTQESKYYKYKDLILTLLTEVSETADCGRKGKSEISEVSRQG